MAGSRDAADRKLIDRLVPDPSDGQILGLLSTSYEMDPEFFETDFLPSALGLGAWSERQWASRIELERHLAHMTAATVLLDARRYRRRPRSFRVETIPVALSGGRAMHAKITLVVHERAVRLLVGSSNLTEQGYRKNREVAFALRASERNPAYAALIRSAVSILPRMFAPWWSQGAGLIASEALVLLSAWSQGDSAGENWFAWTGDTQVPLWEQFVEHWPRGETIARITVVSPFWSAETDRGPVRGLLHALNQRAPVVGARLRLLTEAKPEGTRTWRPVLPEAYGQLRVDDLGVAATAEAVHPEALSSDVDSRAAEGGLRPLHAKVVLVEGQETALAYLGSGNFTRRGWGFLDDPRGANIEAGLVVRRDGKGRDALAALIPPTVGTPVPLDGAATGKLALPEPKQPDAPWPSFLREAVLVPVADDPSRLELALRVDPRQVSGAWAIELLEAREAEPLYTAVGGEHHDRSHRVALSAAVLQTLLEQQEVRVRWWECDGGRAFPLNVDVLARDGLPIAPGARQPGEDHLLAYYQSRIAWEDLFPDPDLGGAADHVEGLESDPSGVDTSKIQAYQIREFVEALRGIRDDLRMAAASPGAMRLALLGPVSPIALARQIHTAVADRKRTPVAAGFQLLEILACIAQARGSNVPERYRSEWHQLATVAEREVSTLLKQLRDDDPHAFANTDGFTRYERTITAYCRKLSIDF